MHNRILVNCTGHLCVHIDASGPSWFLANKHVVLDKNSKILKFNVKERELFIKSKQFIVIMNREYIGLEVVCKKGGKPITSGHPLLSTIVQY